MSDYIKTDKVLDLLAGVVAEIIKMPPEEPEIVRCKDCKYRMNNYNCYVSNFKGGLPCMIRWVNDDDFCSYAKRKKDGEE